MDYNELNRILCILYNVIGEEKLSYKSFCLLRNVILSITDTLKEVINGLYKRIKQNRDKRRNKKNITLLWWGYYNKRRGTRLLYL